MCEESIKCTWTDSRNKPLSSWEVWKLVDTAGCCAVDSHQPLGLLPTRIANKIKMQMKARLRQMLHFSKCRHVLESWWSSLQDNLRKPRQSHGYVFRFLSPFLGLIPIVNFPSWLYKKESICVIELFSMYQKDHQQGRKSVRATRNSVSGIDVKVSNTSSQVLLQEKEAHLRGADAPAVR